MTSATSSDTAQKESPTGSGGTEAGDNENTHEAPIVSEAEARRKRFDTLAARAALKGHQLTQVRSSYILSAWTHSKHFIDLDTAEALIRRMEGGQP